MPVSLRLKTEVLSSSYCPPENDAEPQTSDLAAQAALDIAAERSANLRRGLMLGMLSAVAYSAANLALRGLSGRDGGFAWAVWVSSVKALPTLILASILLVRRFCKGQSLYPNRKPILPLIAAGLVMQFGGNLGFQLALGQIGLAITVPLVFAFIIFAGAMLGKTFLGDEVSRSTIVSMVIMTFSIILLSYAATLNQPDSAKAAASGITGIIWFGIVMAVISGMSYGVNGVVIRSIAQTKLPVESMLIIYSGTGLVCLGTLGYSLMGAGRIAAIQSDEWQMMLCAGTFNAIAFFSITNALKVMNISHVNVINASQNAMCALGAVLIFAEPPSLPMVIGILLSICGLVVLDRK